MKKKIIIFVVIILVLAIAIFTKIMYDVNKNAYIILKINGQEIKITKDTEIEQFNLDTLNTEYNTHINIDSKYASVKFKDNNVEKTIDLGKVEISNQKKIQLDIKFWGELGYKTIFLNTVPSNFTKYEVEINSPTEGEYYLSTYLRENKNSGNYIYKLDNQGRLIFYKKTENIAFNFKKIENEDGIQYSYVESIGKGYEGNSSSIPSKLIILDSKYNKIQEIMYDEQTNVENHDYIYFNKNHYIICAYEKQTARAFDDINYSIWNCKIKEVENNNTLWEFKSTDYDNLYNYYNENGKSKGNFRPSVYLNYMHFNSMAVDPTDNNLVCSFRNIDSLIKINRSTGKIMWILGGDGDEFNLTQDQKFSKQHSVSFLSDGTILLYDNGEKTGNTRILKIKLDEQNKKVVNYERYDLGIYIARMGAVKCLDEEKQIYLLTYGMGDTKYAFEEINLNTKETYFKYKLNVSNYLYCVNKY